MASLTADIDLIHLGVVVNVNGAIDVVNSPGKELTTGLVKISFPTGEMATRTHGLDSILVDWRRFDNIIYCSIPIIFSCVPP
jgi:hypothetical protein